MGARSTYFLPSNTGQESWPLLSHTEVANSTGKKQDEDIIDISDEFRRSMSFSLGNFNKPEEDTVPISDNKV